MNKTIAGMAFFTTALLSIIATVAAAFKPTVPMVILRRSHQQQRNQFQSRLGVGLGMSSTRDTIRQRPYQFGDFRAPMKEGDTLMGVVKRTKRYYKMNDFQHNITNDNDDEDIIDIVQKIEENSTKNNTGNDDDSTQRDVAFANSSRTMAEKGGMRKTVITSANSSAVSNRKIPYTPKPPNFFVSPDKNNISSSIFPAIQWANNNGANANNTSSRTPLQPKSAFSSLQIPSKQQQAPGDFEARLANLEKMMVNTNTPGYYGAGVPYAQSGPKKLAFPQGSVVSSKELRIATSAVSSLYGMVLGTIISNNLWLLGSLAGAGAGYLASKPANATTTLDNKATTTSVVSSFFGSSFLLRSGHFVFQVKDFFLGMWFAIRTGQLSFKFWKQYANLDEQFAIQDKMDAWNARFQEGKRNFDRFEQEHEIGRKTLAFFRTASIALSNGYVRLNDIGDYGTWTGCV